MPEIAFPLSTAPGINSTESGGRLINCYAEEAPPGSRSKHVWRRPPGLTSAVDIDTDDAARGALRFGTQLIVIYGDTAYKVTKSGGGVYTVTALTGTVPGTGPVIMARNMRATPQIIVIHSAGMSKIESDAVADFSDGDLPTANSVAFKDSFFFFGIGDGDCFASGQNDVTVASTDFTPAESSPDGLRRVVAGPNELLLMGENSTEFFVNTAEPTGFPFSRSVVKPFGLKAINAIAGFAEGFTGQIAFVAQDDTVRMWVGTEAVQISQPDLERLISQADPDDLSAYAYVASGRPIFGLQTSDWTWECDLSNLRWRERKSLGQSNWRVAFTVNVFDEWLALDAGSDTLYRLDPTANREGADQIVWDLRSVQAQRFPGRAWIKRASFDFMVGVGSDTGIDPIETKPQVQISWSFDGGKTFGNPVFRSLGRQGQIVSIDVRNCGITRQFGIQWKLVVADSVDVAFFGGAMDIEERAP